MRWTIDFVLYVGASSKVRVDEDGVHHGPIDRDNHASLWSIEVIDKQGEVVAEYTDGQVIDPEHLTEILWAADRAEIRIPQSGRGYYVG